MEQERSFVRHVRLTTARSATICGNFMGHEQSIQRTELGTMAETDILLSLRYLLVDNCSYRPSVPWLCVCRVARVERQPPYNWSRRASFGRLQIYGLWYIRISFECIWVLTLPSSLLSILKRFFSQRKCEAAISELGKDVKVCRR